MEKLWFNAIETQNIEGIKFLINHIDINIKDDVCSNTALLIASSKGYKELVDLLLKNGAEVECYDKLGNNILWGACVTGDKTRLEMFIKDYKLDVNQLLGRYRFTILHRIILQLKEETQVFELIKFMLSFGARVDLKNAEGKTPLFFAAYKGYPQTCKLLIINGATVTATDVAMNTPLHFSSNIEVAKILIENGAKPNAKNKYGNTPLHAAFAFHHNEVEFLNYLQSVGGDVNFKNSFGLTPPDTLYSTLEKKIVMPLLSNDPSLPQYGGLYIEGKKIPGITKKP